jgi:hypothetical protein
MSGSAQITNPNGAFGYTNLETKLFRTEAEFKTSAAIAGAPQVVAIGTDGTIAPAATDSTASLSVGIATLGVERGGRLGVQGRLGSTPTVPHCERPTVPPAVGLVA